MAMASARNIATLSLVNGPAFRIKAPGSRSDRVDRVVTDFKYVSTAHSVAQNRVGCVVAGVLETSNSRAVPYGTQLRLAAPISMGMYAQRENDIELFFTSLACSLAESELDAYEERGGRVRNRLNRHGEKLLWTGVGIDAANYIPTGVGNIGNGYLGRLLDSRLAEEDIVRHEEWIKQGRKIGKEWRK